VYLHVVNVLLSEEGLRCAGSGPVFLNGWATAPTAQKLDQLVIAQRSFKLKNPRFVVVTVVDPRVGAKMEDSARKADHEEQRAVEGRRHRRRRGALDGAADRRRRRERPPGGLPLRRV
jgi:hypothetical protein